MRAGTSALLQYGRLTGRGPAPAGNRVAGETLWASCAQPSAIMERSTGRVPGARSKRDGAGNGMGFVPSAFRQFSRRPRTYRRAASEVRSPATFFSGCGAETARRSHEPEVIGASPVPATNQGRYARGQSSVAVNHVPSGFARSNRCPAHHATVAQSQSHTLPT